MIRANNHYPATVRRWAKRPRVATVIGVLAIGLSCLAPQVSQAQGGTPATLVGRAILPASQLADGPASAVELAKTSKSINGIDLPLMSQPLGNVVAIWPGAYGSWLLLTGTAFDNRQLSADVQLRLYAVQIDWRSNGNGGGQVTAVDWTTLNDGLNKLAAPIQNPGDSARSLTGADFSPHSLISLDKGKSWWIADAHVPSVLHINMKGSLTIAPRPIQAGPDNILQGIAIPQSGKTLYVITATDPQTLTIQGQDLATGTPSGGALHYKLDQAGDLTRGWVMVNDHQALVLESDQKGGDEAVIKRVYLADFTQLQGDGSVAKLFLADLMHLADPGNLGTDSTFGDQSGEIGLKPFTYPFADLTGIYPVSPDTVVIVNNNHVPFNTGRKSKTAENTEFIEVKLPAPLQGLTLGTGAPQ